MRLTRGSTALRNVPGLQFHAWRNSLSVINLAYGFSNIALLVRAFYRPCLIETIVNRIEILMAWEYLYPQISSFDYVKEAAGLELLAYVRLCKLKVYFMRPNTLRRTYGNLQ